MLTVVGLQFLFCLISFPIEFKIEQPDKKNKPGLYCIQFTDIDDKKYALRTINGISLVFEVS